MIERIEDEPIRFYYRNRELIEEWAALGKDAQQLSRQVLADIASDLDRCCPAEASVAPLENSGWEGRGFYRAAWAQDAERPEVAIGLAWSPNRVNLVGNEPPLIGVWRGDRPSNDALFVALRDGLEAHRKAAGFLKKQNWAPWPLWRYIEPPTGEFWDDLTPWRQGVLDAVVGTWTSLADPVDSIMLKR